MAILVAFDVETADSNGASLDFWRPDFRVISSAFSWRSSSGELRHIYCEGEAETAEYLREIQLLGFHLVAHNLQFEAGVVRCRFPWFDRRLLQIDTQRLAQNWDSGGKRFKSDDRPKTLEEELRALEEDESEDKKYGLGLEACVSRILPKQWHNHKEPFYAYLREHHGVKRGQEGKNLHLLPRDKLEAYNTADSDVTLLLAEELIDRFKSINFDWAFDHYLHRCAIERLVAGKVKGIKVDRVKLAGFVDQVKAERAKIRADFFAYYEKEIELIETQRREAWVNDVKTERGRLQREKRVWEAREEWEFNPRSTTQLKQLFVDVVGAKPKFWTKEGKAAKSKREAKQDATEYVPKPSFRAAHLPSYGDGGKILANYKKRELVQRMAENLLKLSEFDGRWHWDLRACGTKTGRYTGGSSGPVKLNIQALARKEKGLMSCLVADDGYVFVSIDLSAGEPVVVAHYSQDENYIANAFGMVGKKPYWKGDLLMLDDPYISFSSISPIGRDKVRKAWDEGWFEGWEESPEKAEKIRDRLKPVVRAFHKTVFLAKMYGQGPKGTVSYAADNGEVLSYADSKGLDQAFWDRLYPRVKRLRDKLKLQVEKQGYLVNAFGFRMTPEHSRLALNYKIQSSVSGIIKVVENKLYSVADYAEPGPVIHDEILPMIPVAHLDQFRADVSAAFDSLNKDLNWTVRIRNGFVPGNNLAEAK